MNSLEVILFLSDLEFIGLHTVKLFQVLLSNTSNSYSKLFIPLHTVKWFQDLQVITNNSV